MQSLKRQARTRRDNNHSWDIRDAEASCYGTGDILSTASALARRAHGGASSAREIAFFLAGVS